MKKLLIFDLDGTLLDTLEDLRSSVNFALKKFGFSPRTLEEIRKSVGNGFKILVNTSLPRDCTEEVAEAVLAEARAHYQEHYHDRTKPYDGILELLRKLKSEGYPLALVSNKPDPMVKCLHELFFADLISYAAGEIPGVPRKPAPNGVWKAIEAFGYDRSQGIYIGDSEVDVLTAKNSALPCLAVTWGFRTEAELQAAGAEVLCANTEELYESIKNSR